MTETVARPVPSAVAGRGRRPISVALDVVLGQPGLWVLGALGFLARGGFLVVALPIWSLPTPVGISTILPVDAFTLDGLSPTFLAAVGPGLAIALVAALSFVFVTAALVDIAAYERFVTDPDTVAARGGAAWTSPGRAARIRALVQLVLVQAALVVPLGIGLAALAVRLAEAVQRELVVPSSMGTPLALRVLSGAAQPLLLLVVTIVLCELLYGGLSRQILGRLGPASAPGARAASETRPFLTSTFRTAATGWAVGAAFTILSLWAIAAAWGAVRAAFLGPGVLVEAPRIVEAAFVAFLFGLLWSAALLLIGFSGAVRSALWTAHALR